MQNNTGFTIVELLVALTISVLIAAMASNTLEKLSSVLAENDGFKSDLPYLAFASKQAVELIGANVRKGGYLHGDYRKACVTNNDGREFCVAIDTGSNKALQISLNNEEIASIPVLDGELSYFSNGTFRTTSGEDINLIRLRVDFQSENGTTKTLWSAKKLANANQ